MKNSNFFYQDIEALFKQNLNNDNLSICEIIYSHCAEYTYVDESRMMQDLLNVINKYYGNDFLLHFPLFTRKGECYSYLLISSLTFRELKLLLLGEKKYELILNQEKMLIEGQKEMEEKFRDLFGHGIDTMNENDMLLSLMNLKNKKYFFELFNQFEYIIEKFLLVNKYDKTDFYIKLRKYIIWDYEDFFPYIPVTFLLSIPYSVLYEAILLGADPIEKLTILEY